MRIFFSLVACCLAVSSAVAQGPSKEDALRQFRAEVLHQRFFLKGFSADDIVKFAWTSGGVLALPSEFHTLGVYTFGNAKLKGDTVELAGERSTLVRDQDGHPALMGEAPVTVDVALHGADPTQVLTSLKAQMTYSTSQDALAAIPPIYTALIPATPKIAQKSSDPPPNCLAPGATFVRPKIISAPDAAYSEQARSAHFNGKVRVALTVDEGGHATNLWLTRPVGLGLDAQALKAVSGYVFQPATCDGVPVKKVLMIEVSFAIL
jgi:TonB family protein